ncbi:OB-fold domain-containing protein [Rhodococcus sp. F64268]|uniref:Zn-ribbon domain-containing OB-fold protein n=1 Tax=Rhodococcus sp. F64268 TaxID=2926402 RepID=UPI001FF2C1EB|nr:OB-fold domain-containing protein [Rhodococcus sp. F64268]MCK0090724.1 OB-fold domain-containing protein [Rhodococcus sp. F64268]
MTENEPSTDTSGIVTASVPDFAPLTDVPELAPFWDGVSRGELVFPRCRACRRWHWYPGPGCPCGHDDEFEWSGVAGRGVIYSFTTVHRAFLPSGSTAPYTVALVEFEDAPGVRLVTDLIGDGADTPRIGDRVVLSPTVFDTHTLPTFALERDRPERERHSR